MLNILFPKVCNYCKKTLLRSEKILCTSCRHQLPLACHHHTGSDAMKNIFYGTCKVVQATALLKFQKRGITQEVLHNLKYRGHQQLSAFFGAWLGAELAEIPSYKSIDMVIPVPLHKQRLKKRGYNQVAGFGKEIAKALQVPYVDDVLLKKTKTNTQVFKQRFKRFQDQKDTVFTIHHFEAIKNKHILLVDDIITTGATLENCMQALQKQDHIEISIATIAITE